MTNTNSSFLKNYKYLSKIELNNLNTKRLLTLLKSLNKPITNLEKYGAHSLYNPNENDIKIHLPKLKKYKEDIKQILKNREHIGKSK